MKSQLHLKKQLQVQGQQRFHKVMQKINIFWFRRDLRFYDNAGLYHALKSGLPVLPVFIFDEDIVGKLPRDDARVSFIHKTVSELKTQVEQSGSSLKVTFGKPLDVFRKLITEFSVSAVYTNRDYEPYARERDGRVGEFLRANAIKFHTFKDHVIFEKDEILKADGSPYTVFTPYSKKWKQQFTKYLISPYDSEKYISALYKCLPFELPTLEKLGYGRPEIKIPALKTDKEIIRNYEKNRDYPSINGTTRLGAHLRFGTASIREVTKVAFENSEVFLNELVWRNFFIDILWHFPNVVTDPFKKQYAFIEWRNNEEEFEKWRRGETGYPLVDAGMRELVQTGFMHNRVRMVAASFLVKHLLIDWRWGEAWFAGKLLDFELASNNGNWQWAAGTGCDAAPYFRVFNPESQQKKFDSKFEYIRKWAPEFNTSDYPARIVEHKFARERALAAYKKALSQN